MSYTFKTLDEAIEAGFTLVNRHTDRDISGGPYYGYDF